MESCCADLMCSCIVHVLVSCIDPVPKLPSTMYIPDVLPTQLCGGVLSALASSGNLKLLLRHLSR
jgi:hypothetical protein